MYFANDYSDYRTNEKCYPSYLGDIFSSQVHCSESVNKIKNIKKESKMQSNNDNYGTYDLNYTYKVQVKNCQSKIIFETKKKAKKVCKSYLKINEFRRAYRCVICHAWHITSNEARLMIIDRHPELSMEENSSHDESS